MKETVHPGATKAPTYYLLVSQKELGRTEKRRFGHFITYSFGSSRLGYNADLPHGDKNGEYI